MTVKVESTVRFPPDLQVDSGIATVKEPKHGCQPIQKCRGRDKIVVPRLSRRLVLLSHCLDAGEAGTGSVASWGLNAKSGPYFLGPLARPNEWA